MFLQRYSLAWQKAGSNQQKKGKRRKSEGEEKENIHTKLIWFTFELSPLLN